MKYVMAVSSGTTPAPVALTVVTSFLPDGIVGTAYTTTTLEATGGTAPYTWTEVELLPPGLTLSSAGVITGTPTDAGSFPVRVQVRDSVGATADSGTLPVSIASANTLRITTANLPHGRVNEAYSQTLAATGGSGTGYTFSVSAGSLPTGLSLSSAGVISGTPTTAQTASVTFRVTDSLSATADSGAYQIVIDPVFALEIVSISPLNAGEVGEAYSRGLVGTGGVEPYTWAVTGSLPDGLTLDTDTGVISGTPTTEETANFTITLTDDAETTTFRQFSLTINAEGTVEGPHDFFNTLVASQYHFKSWAMRSEADIVSVRRPNRVPQTFYVWPSDSFPDAQDAAKIIIPAGVTNYESLWFPLNFGAEFLGEETATLLMIWDFYWDVSWKLGHTFPGSDTHPHNVVVGHKAFHFRRFVGSNPALWFEPRTRFYDVAGDGALCMTDLRIYTGDVLAPGSQGGTNGENDFRDEGGYRYSSDTLAPMLSEFRIDCNVWTRFWVQLTFTAGSKYASNICYWIADENRDAVQMFDNLSMNWQLPGGLPGGRVELFEWEFNHSQDRTPGGEMIAYGRNVLALLNHPDPESLLDRPVR